MSDLAKLRCEHCNQEIAGLATIDGRQVLIEPGAIRFTSIEGKPRIGLAVHDCAGHQVERRAHPR